MGKQIKLRPYQVEARDAVISEWDSGISDTLVSMTMGMGKCLAYGEDVFLANGSVVPSESLLGQDAMVVGLTDTESMRQIPVKAHFFDNGVKPVWEIKVEGGVTIKRTGNHPLWASINWFEGWQDSSGLTTDHSLLSLSPKRWRRVISVRELPPEPTVGITVFSDNHAFVGHVVEHNTEVFLGILAEERRKAQAEQRPFRALIIAHREELIRQPQERVERGWGDRLPIPGIVMASENDATAEIVIATIQTLMRRKRNGELHGRFYRLREVVEAGGVFTHLVTDECFVAGTLVDNLPIENIQNGDYITAFNEKTGNTEKRRVVRTFVNPAPDTLYEVSVNGKSVVCTGNHPFYTDRGWINADSVEKGDVLYDTKMPCLPEGVCPNKKPKKHLVRKWEKESVLLKGLQFGILPRSIVNHNGKNEQEICVKENDRKQPHAEKIGARKNEENAQGDKTQTNGSWGKRQADPRASGNVSERIRGITLRVRGKNKQKEGERVSVSLQDRYSYAGQKNSDRSGRLFAQHSEPTVSRQKEGSPVIRVRVDGITIHERGGIGEFSRVCPDGKVYNLEVEEIHTYTANGLVVHNCHHAVAPSYMELFRALRWLNPNLRHVGVTATPKRSDEHGLKKVYQSVAFRKGIKEAVEELQVLSPFVGMGFTLPVSLNDAKIVAGDYSAGSLDQLLSADNVEQVIIEKWKAHASDRRTIAFTAGVQQAYRLAAAFQAAGITAEAADGTTDKRERRRIIHDYKAGKTQVLVNCMLYTEGFDAPATSCVIMARPTRSDSLYLQAVGRGLRLHPTKSDCIIMDFAPADGRDLIMSGDLLGVPREQKKRVEKAQEDDTILDVFGVFTKRQGIDADPDHVLVKVLDFFAKNTSLKFTHDGRVATASVNKDVTIAVVFPQEERIAKAEEMRDAGLWLPQHDRFFEIVSGYPVVVVEGGKANTLTIGATWDEALVEANEWSRDRMDGALAKKTAGWRNGDASDKQASFARRLGVFREGMTRGQAAQAITHKLALNALKNARIILEDSK